MTSKGFTLIELLVVIGIIAILTGVVAVAVSPGKQFAQARDTQRRSDISAISSAIYQYAVDNNGNIPGDITTTPTNIGTGILDLSDELVPTYLNEIPKDPSIGTDADTKYVIFKEGTAVVASASGETVATITIRR
ncbi:prepilin-type N-terminal cleavage/methylation domain-containing protein [Candidatus Microgenomates bacterium]|nr:prepilin-type N-terminal cleavage/methylation domain-containing protein [Candidatus Microgenomates bacterium]